MSGRGQGIKIDPAGSKVVPITFGLDLLGDIDRDAQKRDMTRADWVRQSCRDSLKYPIKESDVVRGSMEGKTVVVTGILPTLPRDYARDMIRQAGGNPVDAVSKSTDYVVAGDESGSRLSKAIAFGIPVIDEAEMIRLLTAPIAR